MRGGFCRIYPGQRILLGDQVLTYQELAHYFNAKKNVSLPQIFVRVRQRFGRSGAGTRAHARKRLRGHFRAEGARQSPARRRCRPQRHEAEGRRPGRSEPWKTRSSSITTANSIFIDLRRRARALGGRFQLKASKSEYLVSNNPSLLEADDILLSPGTGGDVLLKIFCDYDKRSRAHWK